MGKQVAARLSPTVTAANGRWHAGQRESNSNVFMWGAILRDCGNGILRLPGRASVGVSVDSTFTQRGQGLTLWRSAQPGQDNLPVCDHPHHGTDTVVCWACAMWHLGRLHKCLRQHSQARPAFCIHPNVVCFLASICHVPTLSRVVFTRQAPICPTMPNRSPRSVDSAGVITAPARPAARRSWASPLAPA